MNAPPEAVRAKDGGGSSQASDIDSRRVGKCTHFPATGGSTMNSLTVGVDIAKLVFQVHYIDQKTGVVVNKPDQTGEVPSALVGMEAWGELERQLKGNDYNRENEREQAGKEARLTDLRRRGVAPLAAQTASVIPGH